MVLLLSLFALQAVLSLRGKFATFDEALYLSGGYSYLVTGDTRMVNLYHPPLAQFLVALPLANLDLAPPERDPAWSILDRDLSSRDFAVNFLYRSRVPWQTILTRGRLMMVGLGVVVGLVVFVWAAELWGLSGGFLALTLYAFSPNLLAHSRLTTTDFPVAGLCFGACYLLWRFFRQPGFLRLALAGLVLGLALLTKLSALIFCLIFVLLGALYVAVPGATTAVRPGWRARLDGVLARRRAPRAMLAGIALMVILALASAVIWMGYLGATSEDSREDVIHQARVAVARVGRSEATTSSGPGLAVRLFPLATRVIPWPKQYWELFAWLLAKGASGHPAFLAGRQSMTGWWYYFPVALAIKTPLPTLILVLGALAAGWRRKRLYDGCFLLLPPVVFLLVSMTSHVNIGYRHILPMLPFLLVFGSQVATWEVKRTWQKWVLLAVLLVWYVGGTLRVAPHYLAYFNELVGGPRSGYHYLVDSNLDWGQDLVGLGDYVREHNVEELKLAYFGLTTPDVVRSLGIHDRPIRRREELRPTPGLYAVSATRLQGAYRTELFSEDTEKPFHWLRKLEPEAVIGYSIFVYRVTEADVARLKEQGQ